MVGAHRMGARSNGRMSALIQDGDANGKTGHDLERLGHSR